MTDPTPPNTPCNLTPNTLSGDDPSAPAWDALVQEHGPWLWTLLMRMLGDRHEAEDCLQQTFLKAVEVADRQPVTHWPALLKRIATTRAIDRIRQLARHNQRTHLDPDPDRHAPQQQARTHAPDARMTAHELIADLRQGLTRLPPDQATTFVLVCVEGLDNATVASQLNITVTNVKTRVSRARKALAQYLNAPPSANRPARRNRPGSLPESQSAESQL